MPHNLLHVEVIHRTPSPAGGRNWGRGVHPAGQGRGPTEAISKAGEPTVAAVSQRQSPPVQNTNAEGPLQQHNKTHLLVLSAPGQTQLGTPRVPIPPHSAQAADRSENAKS